METSPAFDDVGFLVLSPLCDAIFLSPFPGSAGRNALVLRLFERPVTITANYSTMCARAERNMSLIKNESILLHFQTELTEFGLPDEIISYLHVHLHIDLQL